MNTFIWSDLSTYDPLKGINFYGKLFSWSTYAIGGGAERDDYTLFYSGRRPASAIYTMPPFFQKINMPSFWMSYVLVRGLDGMVARAVELGAKCEIEPTPLDASSRFALIRDPAGAGFTLYEGDDLGGRDDAGRPDRMVWNELHVSSLDLVQPFYTSLFGWGFKPDVAVPGRYIIQTADGRDIASLMAIEEEIKGTKTYWVVFFSTKNLASSLAQAIELGGQVLMRSNQTEPKFAMLADDQGAVFCLTE